MGGGDGAPRTAGIRTACFRTGIVLSADGGALAKQLPLFRFGVGGRMGPGTQWLPWIALEDEVGAIVHLLTADVEGPVNLAAPEPVTNATFIEVLGRVLGRPTFLRPGLRPPPAARAGAGRRGSCSRAPAWCRRSSGQRLRVINPPPPSPPS